MTARVPVAQRREARAAERRRHVAGQYAKAGSASAVVAVEFDRVRAALKALARRNPEAAERAWADLAGLLGRFADRYESVPRQRRR